MLSDPVSIGRGHTDSVVALSLSDRLLASGGEDGSVYLWSLGQSSFPVLHAPRNEPCSSLKFSIEKPDILYSAHNRQLLSWDVRILREPLSQWNVNEDEINSIDLLDKEARLASSDDSGSIQLVDTNTGQIIRTLKKHDNICSCAKFRPNRTWQLISGGLDCRVIVSDWKGTGLGVIIFEMNEIIDDILDDSSQPSSHQSDQASVSGESADDIVDDEIGNLIETEEEPVSVGALESFNSPSLVTSLSPSSGLGSDVTERSESRIDNTASGAGDNAHNVLQTRLQMNPLAVSLEDETSTSSRNTTDVWRSGLPVNPPMVHTIACSSSGDFVAAGLESSTIELFSGEGKRLCHLESLYGHSRGVSALKYIDDSFLVSGGNDRNLFVWSLNTDITGYHIFHGEKISAIEGKQLDRVFVADFSPVVQVLDLSIC